MRLYHLKEKEEENSTHLLRKKQRKSPSTPSNTLPWPHLDQNLWQKTMKICTWGERERERKTMQERSVNQDLKHPTKNADFFLPQMPFWNPHLRQFHCLVKKCSLIMPNLWAFGALFWSVSFSAGKTGKQRKNVPSIALYLFLSPYYILLFFTQAFPQFFFTSYYIHLYHHTKIIWFLIKLIITFSFFRVWCLRRWKGFLRIQNHFMVLVCIRMLIPVSSIWLSCKTIESCRRYNLVVLFFFALFQEPGGFIFV